LLTKPCLCIALQAIRLRQYFEGEASSASAAVKRLRFNARFIVVCLLLNKKEVRKEQSRVILQQSKHQPSTVVTVA